MIDILYSFFEYLGQIAPLYWSGYWAGLNEVNPKPLNDYTEAWLIERESR